MFIANIEARESVRSFKSIAIFSHYTGDSIFNMLDRDVIMINWKEIK